MGADKVAANKESSFLERGGGIGVPLASVEQSLGALEVQARMFGIAAKDALEPLVMPVVIGVGALGEKGATWLAAGKRKELTLAFMTLGIALAACSASIPGRENPGDLPVSDGVVAMENTAPIERGDTMIDWIEFNSPEIADRFRNAELPDNPWERHLISYQGISTDLTVPSSATYRNELVVEFGATADGVNFALLVKGQDEAIALLSFVDNKYVAQDAEGRPVEVNLDPSMISDIQNTFRDKGTISLLVVAHTETGLNPHDTEYPELMDAASANPLGINALFAIPTERPDSDEEIPPRVETFDVSAESSNAEKLKDSYFIKVTYPDGTERYFSPFLNKIMDPSREVTG